MAVKELSCITAEEVLSVSPREELHGHRVNLAAFHARPCALHGTPCTVHPVGKGVTRLMSNRFNVRIRAVEVRKYKRNLIVVKGGAVTAALLTLG